MFLGCKYFFKHSSQEKKKKLYFEEPLLSHGYHVFQISGMEKVDKNTIKFTLQTDNIAPFVWLEATGMDGFFSDNGFIMVDASRELYFYSWGDSYTVTDLNNAIKAMSLMDIYADQELYQTNGAQSNTVLITLLLSLVYGYCSVM